MGPLEQVHHRYLLARVCACIGQRTRPVRGERMLHQWHSDKRIRRVSKLQYPYFNFLCGDEYRLLELAQQKLLLHALADPGVQSSYPEAFGCRQPGKTIFNRLLAKASNPVGVGRMLRRVAHHKPVHHEPSPPLSKGSIDLRIPGRPLLLG
jgi:hypothetical protein